MKANQHVHHHHRRQKLRTQQPLHKGHAQLTSLQFCDQELARLQAQAAAIQTARIAYSKALQAALPITPVGETLKFS